MLAAAIWHNVLHSPNVNADVGVTALDALTVINELNNRVYSDPDTAGLVSELPEAKRPPYYDVNCDGRVTAGTEVIVTARLVNNDDDDVSTIVVRDIKPVTGLELPPLVYEGEPIDAIGDWQPIVLEDLEDVSSSMQAEYGRTSYTTDRSHVTSDLIVTNHGNQAVTGEMIVVLDQFSDVETSLMHPDGLLPDGRPYFNLTDYMDGALEAGASTRPREIRFTNPSQQRFDYRLTTLGDLNLAPRGFDTTPNDKTEAAIPTRVLDHAARTASVGSRCCG